MADTRIPEQARHLFEGKNFASVSTVMEDGSPQGSTVWIDAENGTVRFNTAKGRVKHRNIERDPRVAISVHNEENPYEQILVRGTAEVDPDTEAGDDHIDDLAKKYMDADSYPGRVPGEERIIVRVTPEKVNYTPGS